MTIIIDIETLPNQSATAQAEIGANIKPPAQMKKAETIQEWLNGTGKYEGAKDAAINDQYLKTSFDGGYGSICCICVDDNGKERTYTDESGEAALLADFWNDLRTDSPYFVAHNAKFDLPFIWHRSVVLQIQPSKFFKVHGRHNSDHFCTMEAWAGFNGKISLNNLSKILGLGQKTEGMDGSQVWPEYQKGNIKKIAEYCMDDVRLTKAIHNKLNFL